MSTNDDETLFTYLETYSDSETGLFHAVISKVNMLDKSLSGLMVNIFYGDVSNEFKNWAKTMVEPGISV